MLDILSILLALIIELFFEDTSSHEEYDYSQYEYSQSADIEDKIDHVPHENTGTDWAIYWYLCGSDLESDYGAATDDLLEMMDVTLPEGVKIIIQTGGAYEWHNSIIDEDYTQRYIYDSNGLELIEQLPISNMGAQNTLEEFLYFAHTNYPADRIMLDIWNHGGGSVTGVAFDELFYDDSLTLNEMENALINVYGIENEYYPIDIVAFDSCLMATLSTANVFKNHANYMVASQELMPSNGFYYTGLLEIMSQNTTISPAELSVAICDTFEQGCIYEDTDWDITISVTDLSKIDDVIKAYENYSITAFDYAVQNPSFFAQYSQIANDTENYGGNTYSQGYSNMVDLGTLVTNTQDLFYEQSQQVLNALDKAVLYTITSEYRPDAMGLSTYYTYDSDIDMLYEFMDVNPVESLNYLYMYGLTGQVDNEGMQYLEENLSYTEQLPQLQTIETIGERWENAPLTIDNEGNAVLNLGPEAYNALSSVKFELYYSPINEDTIISLGIDNDITGDWEKGVFIENFRGVWGHIDGAICYMELINEKDEYNEYSVPVLLNGEEYNLTVIYNFEKRQYQILGARKPITLQGAADKNFIQLKPGDIIQTVHYVSNLNTDEDFETTNVDTITVTKDTVFTEEWLPDGYYFLMFVMEDSRGDIAYSDIVAYESVDGDIYTYYDN